MRIASSAYLTCSAFLSASEYTATIWIPSSLQARIMRMAISPRLAIRILLNILCKILDEEHEGADDETSEKKHITQADVSVFILHKVNPRIINLAHHDLIGAVGIVHDLFHVLGI